MGAIVGEDRHLTRVAWTPSESKQYQRRLRAGAWTGNLCNVWHTRTSPGELLGGNCVKVSWSSKMVFNLEVEVSIESGLVDLACCLQLGGDPVPVRVVISVHGI